MWNPNQGTGAGETEAGKTGAGAIEDAGVAGEGAFGTAGSAAAFAGRETGAFGGDERG